MKEPEELALIGGSILLASTLIFTLKSQASNILPKIGDALHETMQGKSDEQMQKENAQNQANQAQNDFNTQFQQASQNHWQTGTWGTSKYYVDNNENMHVGTGAIQGPLYQSYDFLAIGGLKTITFVPGVQFPTDSSGLFQNMSDLHAINGMKQANLPAFDSTEDMFTSDVSLADLDISNFDTTHAATVGDMLTQSVSHSITLGDKTILENDNSNPNIAGINNGHWRNGNQVLYYNALQDGRPHPGTWVKQ